MRSSFGNSCEREGNQGREILVDELVVRAFNILKSATEGDPITSTELGYMLQINESNGNPVARGIIDDVIRKCGLPLVSCSRGYYVAIREEDIEMYDKDINDRIAGMVDRLATIKENFITYQGAWEPPPEPDDPWFDDDEPPRRKARPVADDEWYD